jgi:hypothetical protein
MQISSGSSPMAYVLSNYDAASSSGETLFKFNPMIFSSSPIWIIKTIDIVNIDYGHLGLKLGRDQNLLYAFSWSDSKSTITLLDIDGNSKW